MRLVSQIRFSRIFSEIVVNNSNNLEQLLGSANGYNDDPRFKANFDKIHPHLAAFMREAVTAYVSQSKISKALTRRPILLFNPPVG